MNWRIRLALFCILAVPAFTGYPLGYLEVSLIPGLSAGWIAYAVVVHTAALCLLGPSPYRVALIICLLITLPVVCLGTAISLIGLYFQGWSSGQLNVIIAHYIALGVTMITVIPLALSIVAMVPFHRIESRLLNKAGGVTLMEKSVLMFARVCIHVIYFVIPDILEVLREERIFAQIAGRQTSPEMAGMPLRFRTGILVRTMIQVGVEGICSAVRYIPLWAEEIARLPGRKARAKPDRDNGGPA